MQHAIRGSMPRSRYQIKSCRRIVENLVHRFADPASKRLLNNLLSAVGRESTRSGQTDGFPNVNPWRAVNIHMNLCAVFRFTALFGRRGLWRSQFHRALSHHNAERIKWGWVIKAKSKYNSPRLFRNFSLQFSVPIKCSPKRLQFQCFIQKQSLMRSCYGWLQIRKHFRVLFLLRVPVSKIERSED